MFPRFPEKYRPAPTGVLVLLLAMLTLVGCSPSENALHTDVPEDSGSATSLASYPVPDGCPSAEEFGEAWIERRDWADALDAPLLDAEVSVPLPPGGCAYAEREVRTSTSSLNTYRRVQVWYFNLGEPDRQTQGALAQWAESVGGVPGGSEQAFALPDSFSGWSGSTVSSVDGEGSYWFFGQDVIPEYTQGASGRVEFNFDAARVETLVDTSGEDVDDPTLALAQGRAAAFATSFSVEDQSGYTVDVDVAGRLQPFASDITNVAPGKFEAIGSATVRGEVRNTTEGRNAKSPRVHVVALYPIGVDACIGQSTFTVEKEGWLNPSHCFVSIGSLNIATLAPGGVQEYVDATEKLKLGAFDEAGEALSQVNAPVSIYAYFGGTGRRADVAWLSDQGCQVRSETVAAQWAVPMSGWPDILCG